MPNTINISRNMRFFVYVIGTKYPKVRTYVGWSNDIKKRLKAHNESKGAKFTRGSKSVSYTHLTLPTIYSV